MDFLSLKEYLNKFGQAHLLEYYNELDSEQKEVLLNQISRIKQSLVDSNLIIRKGFAGLTTKNSLQ